MRFFETHWVRFDSGPGNHDESQIDAGKRCHCKHCREPGHRRAWSAFNGDWRIPSGGKALEDQGRELRALRDDIKRLHDGAKNTGGDGWLDTKGAAEYLALSPGTFDKYRYQTQPSIKGYRVGGKTLYKRTDLDAFVMLFEARSGGLA